MADDSLPPGLSYAPPSTGAGAGPGNSGLPPGLSYSLPPGLSSAPPDDEDARWRARMTKNEKGEGYYSMKGVGGTLNVPHSDVVDAATRGYDFANEEDRTRFKNNAHPANWDLQDIPGVGKFMQNVSGRLAGNLQNMSNVVAGEHPLDALLHGTTEGETMFVNPNAPVANMTGDILSFLATDKTISELPTASLRLNAASKVLATVEKLPPGLQNVIATGMEHSGLQGSRLARAVEGAVTGAPRMALQDLATGRGAGQAAVSGTLGAVMPFAAEGAGAATSKVGQGASNVLDRFKPPTVSIGSQAAVPVEPGQIGELGEILPTGTDSAQMARTQQAAFDLDMKHSARRAVRSGLQNLNDAIGPPSRPMLPPPSGEDVPVFHLTGPPTEEEAVASPFQQRPGVFQRQGPPTSETATGELLHPAQPLPRTTTPSASYAGPWERTPGPEGGMAGSSVRPGPAGAMHPGPEVQGPIKLEPGETIYKAGTGDFSELPPTPPPQTWEQVLAGEKPPGPPNFTGDVRRTKVGGGGISGQTKNPAEAVAYRNEYRRIMESPEFRTLPAEQQARIRQYHDWLTDEIGAYYAQPHGGIIPADIASATANTHTLGDAADQLKNAAAPGFAELNSLTKGRINELSEEIQKASSTLYDPAASLADKKAARGVIAASDAETSDLIARHAGDTPITRQYYQAMKQTYADSSLLRDFNNVIEGWANGISRENTAKSSNLVRVIRANTQDLEDLLSKGNNRQRIARLMGPDAEEAFKSWGQLLADPATARKTGGVLNNIVDWGTRHKLQAFAWTASPIMGVAFPRTYAAVTGGYLATLGARKAMRAAAMNPTATRLIRYAVENDVDPRIYSPLIARAISSLTGSQGEQPQQQQQPQQ